MSESMNEMDRYIADLEARLRSARLTAEDSRSSQEDLFDRHAALIKALHDLNCGRQGIQEVPSGSNKPSLIVLLIGANTCHFHGDVLKRRHGGGRDAAEGLYQQVLSFASKRRLPTRNCQVMIKCYGNLHLMSKEASRKGIVGAEGRSLSAFFFGFSSAFLGCEFVDVGEDVYDRIAENASVYRTLPSCTHVIIAARPSDEVTWDRITPRSPELARHTTVVTRGKSSVVPSRRGYNIEEFEDVFDWSDLRPARRSLDFVPRHSGSGVAAGLQASRYASPPPGVRSRIWANEPSDSATGERQDLIPVNSVDHRVDPPIPALDGRTIERYNDIKPRPCNNMHLFGGCRDPGACPYDHRRIDEGLMNVLRVQMRLYACKRKGACRTSRCVNSHMCQRCPGGNKQKACKLPHAMHGVNPTVANLVRASIHDTDPATFARPMSSSFVGARNHGENTGPHEGQDEPRHDAAEPSGEVVVEENVSDQMLLLEFSDDE